MPKARSTSSIATKSRRSAGSSSCRYSCNGLFVRSDASSRSPNHPVPVISGVETGFQKRPGGCRQKQTIIALLGNDWLWVGF